MSITQKQVNAATNALLKHAQNLGKKNIPNWLIDSKLMFCIDSNLRYYTHTFYIRLCL